MIERTTVRLPRELLARAKRKAVAERRTVTSLIEEGLRFVVDGAQSLHPSAFCHATATLVVGLCLESIFRTPRRFRKWKTWNMWSA